MENISTLRDGPVPAPRFAAEFDRCEKTKLELADRFKLLVVHDGYEEFGYEIGDLRRAGLPADSEIEILTVADPFLPPLYLPDGDMPDLGYFYDDRISGHYGLRSFAELFHKLDTASQIARRKLNAAFPSWSVRSTVSAELPARAVIDKAMRWQPDLVVIGSDQLTSMQRHGLRRLTRRLTSEARCSVRVVRARNQATDTSNRIMIGLDGSEHAAAALEAARRRSWAPGSQAYLVSCIEPVITDELDWVHDYVELDRRRMETMLAEATALLQESGLEVAALIPIGNPAQIIVDEAKRLNIESIFLGTRDLGLVGYLLSGSVSATVASRAACSVEIATSPQEPQPRVIEPRLAA